MNVPLLRLTFSSALRSPSFTLDVHSRFYLVHELIVARQPLIYTLFNTDMKEITEERDREGERKSAKFSKLIMIRLMTKDPLQGRTGKHKQDGEVGSVPK